VTPGKHDALSAVFLWTGAPAYKNERLAAYQKMLAARGITKSADVKILVAQVIQENGSLSESVHGDAGCSVGILQYNACVHHGLSAKRFLQKHPEWSDWRFQLERMADMVAERYALYDGDIKRVVVHHNRPASAAVGRDTPAGYYKAVASRTSLLSPL
jgi:hypothetical protein